MPYFTYKGKSCYYEEQGNGTPLVLLHGNSASSNMFYFLAPLLAHKYKIILIDFLGHGQSERVESFATDLWFDEAMQVVAFLEQNGYDKVHLLGSSGGALAAINVALERPELVGKVIADSFEGESPLPGFINNLQEDREASKQDEGGRMFYEGMHGEGWESVVDNDTAAIAEHAKSIGKFFHRPLSSLQAPILLTGSKEDEFVLMAEPDFYKKNFAKLIEKIGHGEIHLFEHGGHPAALSAGDDFANVAIEFLAR